MLPIMIYGENVILLKSNKDENDIDMIIGDVHRNIGMS